MGHDLAEPLPATLALLLGGRSRRMGVAKHRLRRASDGVSLLRHQLERLAPYFQATLLLAGGHAVPPVAGALILPDAEPWAGEGPLAGLLAALRAAKGEWVAVAPIDQPRLSAGLYRYALEQAAPAADAVIFSDQEGREQWLCGLYRKELRERLEHQLAAGVRAVKRFGATLDLHVLEPPQKNSLVSMNTPAEAAALGFGEFFPADPR